MTYLLLQDECRELSKWFAGRIDARWVLRNIFSGSNLGGDSMYLVFNHNGTLLGKFKTRKAAEHEAGFYRDQTGNGAYVLTRSQYENI